MIAIVGKSLYGKSTMIRKYVHMVNSSISDCLEKSRAVIDRELVLERIDVSLITSESQYIQTQLR
jgi:ABC-type phosphate/phosphonate transport system ATPase subunit